uniref:DUF4515 domain-containing protein n=1 Tax=Ascaris lumbricoides TaxID=6252 RepID=A0A0M3I3V0_ASCLU
MTEVKESSRKSFKRNAEAKIQICKRKEELRSEDEKMETKKYSLLVQARRERDYNREALCTFERKVAEEQQRMEKETKRQSDLSQKCADMLVQARRERDYNREALCTFERKVAEEQQRMEKETKRQSDLSQKCADMTKQIAMLEAEVNRLSTELKLTKDAHNADKALWEIERSHFTSNKEGDASESCSPAVAQAGSEDQTMCMNSFGEGLAEFMSFRWENGFLE